MLWLNSCHCNLQLNLVEEAEGTSEVEPETHPDGYMSIHVLSFLYSLCYDILATHARVACVHPHCQMNDCEYSMSDWLCYRDSACIHSAFCKDFRFTCEYVPHHLLSAGTNRFCGDTICLCTFATAMQRCTSTGIRQLTW